MSRFAVFSRLPVVVSAVAASAILSGCVVAPIGPRPVLISPAPVYIEPATVVVKPLPLRGYYWHRGKRYWRY